MCRTKQSIRYVIAAFVWLTASFSVLDLSADEEVSKGTVWNGEQKKGGKGYTSPKGEGQSIAVQDTVGHSGSNALVFSVTDKSGWIGAWWNWQGWWPEGSGIDTSAYKNLVLWVKVEGEVKLPGFSVALQSSVGEGKKCTGALQVRKYASNFADGEWHEVRIPLADLVASKGTDGFDKKKVWSIMFSNWSGERETFKIYIDDIGFDNKETE